MKTQVSLRVMLALAGTAALGCSVNAPLYFEGETFEAAGNEEMFPTTGLTLRFRQPTDLERMRLQEQADALGYGMDVPWVSRDKVHIEISYKVTNLSDGMGSFALIVDGANEYTQYDTQLVAEGLGGDDPVILPLITTVARTLEAGAAFSGVVREDDFAEGELDLDALGRWNDADPNSTTGPTFAGVLINRSEVPPHIGMGMVPDYELVCPAGIDPAYCEANPSLKTELALKYPGRLVVPAMIVINVRLRATAAMRCEYYVRVRDDEDRLWHNDADDVFQPSPALFHPPALM